MSSLSSDFVSDWQNSKYQYHCKLCSYYCNRHHVLKKHMIQLHGTSVKEEIICKKIEPISPILNTIPDQQNLNVKKKKLTRKKKYNIAKELELLQDRIIQKIRELKNSPEFLAASSTTSTESSSELNLKKAEVTKCVKHSEMEMETSCYCPDCGQRYKDKWSLNEHFRCFHEKIIRYQCSYCDFKHYHKVAVRNHWKHNHWPQPFHVINLYKRISCEHCTRRFVSSERLIKHMKRYHPMLFEEIVFGNLAPRSRRGRKRKDCQKSGPAMLEFVELVGEQAEKRTTSENNPSDFVTVIIDCETNIPRVQMASVNPTNDFKAVEIFENKYCQKLTCACGQPISRTVSSDEVDAKSWAKCSTCQN